MREDAWLGKPVELTEDEEGTSSPQASDTMLDLSACTGSRSEELGQRAGDTLMSPRSTKAPQASHGTHDGDTTHSPHSLHCQIHDWQGGTHAQKSRVEERKWRRRRRRAVAATATTMVEKGDGDGGWVREETRGRGRGVGGVRRAALCNCWCVGEGDEGIGFWVLYVRRVGHENCFAAEALFSSQNFVFLATVAFSFLFDKHCPITE